MLRYWHFFKHNYYFISLITYYQGFGNVTSLYVVVCLSRDYLVTSVRCIYVIWMWIDWYRKYQPAEPEYEVWWRVSEANESQASYSVEQTDSFQYQYSHSDDMFIIFKLNINTDTSIFVFSREKSHDSKYSKYVSPNHSS